MKLKLIMIMMVGLLASCATYQKDGVKINALMANVETSDVKINTDAFVGTAGSVAKFGIVGNVVKSVVKTAGGVLDTKEVGKTARSADANATSAIIDGNARAIKEVELGVGLEKFRIKNAKP
jgi:hypothetical protein